MPPKTRPKTIRDVNLSEASAAWVDMEARRRGLSRGACVAEMIEKMAAGGGVGTGDAISELSIQLYHWLRALNELKESTDSPGEIGAFCRRQMEIFNSLRDIVARRHIDPSGVLLGEAEKLAKDALRKLEAGNVTAAKLRLKDIRDIAEAGISK